MPTVEAYGAKMYGTASACDFNKLTQYGVKPIDYRSQDFENVIKLSEPHGLQAVFDHIGGKNLCKGYRVLAPGGSLVSYAFIGRPGHVLVGTIRGAMQNILLGLLPGKHTARCAVPDHRSCGPRSPFQVHRVRGLSVVNAKPDSRR